MSWKWERMLPDGDAVGPVVICRYLDRQEEPETVDEWARWVKRSEARAFAEEHGFIFEAHDAPDD